MRTTPMPGLVRLFDTTSTAAGTARRALPCDSPRFFLSTLEITKQSIARSCIEQVPSLNDNPTPEPRTHNAFQCTRHIRIRNEICMAIAHLLDGGVSVLTGSNSGLPQGENEQEDVLRRHDD